MKNFILFIFLTLPVCVVGLDQQFFEILNKSKNKYQYKIWSNSEIISQGILKDDEWVKIPYKSNILVQLKQITFNCVEQIPDNIQKMPTQPACKKLKNGWEDYLFEYKNDHSKTFHLGPDICPKA